MLVSRRSEGGLDSSVPVLRNRFWEDSRASWGLERMESTRSEAGGLMLVSVCWRATTSGISIGWIGSFNSTSCITMSAAMGSVLISTGESIGNTHSSLCLM